MVSYFGPPGVWVNGIGPLKGSFKRENERVDARTLGPKMKPDPTWNFVDSRGHFHAWNEETGKVFTAEEKFSVHVEQHCELCDAPEEYEESLGFFCVLCNEKIETPRMVEDWNTPDTIPGRSSWSVEFDSARTYEHALWKLLRVPTNVSVRVPSIKGFGIGVTELTGVSSLGYDFIVNGLGEFGRHG